MQNLIYFAGGALAPDQDLLRNLRGEFVVAEVDVNASTRDAIDQIREAFDGQPPIAVVADLRGAADCLPVRHMNRLLRLLWDDDCPLPLYLALMDISHLKHPDWPALVDDFVLPPHSFTELSARLRRLLFDRRHVRGDNTVKLLDITVDFTTRSVTDASGTALDLTPREFELFAFLVRHRGRFFPRERLLDLVWGVDFDGGGRTVDIHIHRLRAKLPENVAVLMETRRGLGYGIVLR